MFVDRDCLYCATRFHAHTQRRVFCSDICRARYNRELECTCFYCGDLADSRDHITPHSALVEPNRLFDGRETVPCCRECNSLLGDHEPHNLPRRIQYLIAAMIRKYDLDIMIPEWADVELEELGYSLRSAVRGKMRRRQRALERVLAMRGLWRKIVLAYEL